MKILIVGGGGREHALAWKCAQSPRVRLYSEPALSDAETLSWVVLGRASATSGGESIVLQQAALAVLGGLGKGGTGGGLASRFGLDEMGFKGPGSGGDLRESAVTLIALHVGRSPDPMCLAAFADVFALHLALRYGHNADRCDAVTTLSQP